jgi:hypothetical protein
MGMENETKSQREDYVDRVDGSDHDIRNRYSSTVDNRIETLFYGKRKFDR